MYMEQTTMAKIKMSKEQIENRRRSRDFAFLLIYEANVQKDKDLADLMADTAELVASLETSQDFHPDETEMEYIKTTVAGVLEKREEIDVIISENAHGWKLKRISATSGAILRLAIYEMLYNKNVPFVVAINEAVELAKKYDDDKGPKFINGILNAVAEQKGLKPAKAKKPDANAAPASEETKTENGGNE